MVRSTWFNFADIPGAIKFYSILRGSGVTEKVCGVDSRPHVRHTQC